MRKIMIIGSGGAGKSTFARKLGQRLQLDVFHLDALLWKPNWVGVPKEEQRHIQKNLVQKESWIIDGNYGGTMDIRMDEADTIIFLDLPRTLCVYRAMKRMVLYRKKTRPDMAKDCPERFNIAFLKWIWRYPNEKRPAILAKLNALSEEKTVVHLRRKKDVRAFLEEHTV